MVAFFHDVVSHLFDKYSGHSVLFCSTSKWLYCLVFSLAADIRKGPLTVYFFPLLRWKSH